MKNVNNNFFHEVLFFWIISYKIVPSGVRKLLWLKAGKKWQFLRKQWFPYYPKIFQQRSWRLDKFSVMFIVEANFCNITFNK